MSLTTRVSAFFLAALALVLLGFSITLFLVAWYALHHQAEERRQAVLNTLVATAEIEPGGVDWEGQGRDLVISDPDGSIRWVVHDDRGQMVDHWRGLPEGEPLRQLDSRRVDGAWTAEWGGQSWDCLQQTVVANGPVGEDPHLHAALVISVAMPRGPIRTTLQRLALTLAAVSVVSWLLAFAGGRYLCRRALHPLTTMAEAARIIRATDIEQRLPIPRSADELAALASAFNALLDRLHEAHERQRQFTGDASHQLRTPLTAMLGQVEVSLRQPRPAEEYRRVLERVHGQALHLQQLVEMLLYLARADAEAHLTDLEELHLPTWLTGHLANWSGHPRVADLHVEPSSEVSAVRVQPPLLGQLLDNLLDNACKYSTPGSSIELNVRPVGTQVVLAVTDHGCGIAAEDLPHIFGPFYRTRDARRTGRPGYGLGLAVVRRIATLFGGQVRVESQVGRGSRFELVLPAAPTFPEVQSTDEVPGVSTRST
jgi:two-component system, OmpR family, sensor kinase